MQKMIAVYPDYYQLDCIIGGNSLLEKTLHLPIAEG
jgi:hypothetical protein